MTVRTQTSLQSQIDSLFADNETGNLSPADARSIMTDLNDTAFANLESGAIIATTASLIMTGNRAHISVIQANTATLVITANQAT